MGACEEPVKREHVVIATETRACQDHGAYEAKYWDIQPKPAPIRGKPYPPLMGGFWSNCPTCDAAWQLEVDRRDTEIRNGTSERERLRNMRLAEMGIPPRYKDASIWTWQHQMDQQRRVWEWARDYCQGFHSAVQTGRSAVFTGAPGTGKTLLACGMLLHVGEKGGTGLYVTAAEMSARVRSTYNRDADETEQQAIEAFVCPDFLVIDEVGRQTDTPHEQTILFRVLDERYRNLKPVLLVSNLGKTALHDFLGVSLWDRLREAGGAHQNFDWVSQRSSKLRLVKDEQ